MLNRCKGIISKLLLLGVLMFVPSFAMAQSDNTLTKDMIVEVKGYDFTLEEANQLKINLKDPIVYQGQPVYFYVDLEGAKWLDTINMSSAPSYFSGATFKKLSDTKLEVAINNSIPASTYYIPLLTEITGGQAKVSIDGGSTVISSLPLTTFAVTSDQKALVSTADVTALRTEGIVASIKVDEIIKGSLVESTQAEDRTITFTLLNPNYEFENDKPVVTPTKGYYQMVGIATNYVSIANKPDKGVIQITLPQKTNNAVQGSLNITQIKVKAKSNQVQTGKIQIRVSGPNVQESVVTVAETLDYGFSVVNKLAVPAEIKVGSKNGISFSIKENVLNSMIPGKTVQVLLDKGRFAPSDNASIADLEIQSIKLNNQDITKQVSLYAIQKEGYLVGFSFAVPQGIDSTKQNEIQFNNVQVYAQNGTTGDVKVLLELVGVEDDKSAIVAVIKPVSTISVEPVRLKVALKDQMGGKLIISETDKDMIRRGTIELEIEKEPGISFPKVPVVTVIAGDITLGSVRYDDVNPNILKIEVSRTSTKAASIEIKDFVVTTDGTVPDGGYKLTVKGSAIAPDIASGAIEYKDFMIVGELPTAVTPVVPTGKVISKFIIDNQVYDVNGEQRMMDAKAYLEEGRTMVPLRYVADAIGITSQDIKYVSGVVTLVTPGKTIMLYEGKNKVHVNGQEILINGNVVIKEGRTYVPVAEIARLLGIKVIWDPQAKMATFEK